MSSLRQESMLDVIRQLNEAKAAIAELVVALERSRVALDDWLHTYAAELCDEQRVTEARKRISKYGTIGYIAGVQRQNRVVLAKHKGAQP